MTFAKLGVNASTLPEDTHATVQQLTLKPHHTDWGAFLVRIPPRKVLSRLSSLYLPCLTGSSQVPLRVMKVPAIHNENHPPETMLNGRLNGPYFLTSTSTVFHAEFSLLTLTEVKQVRILKRKNEQSAAGVTICYNNQNFSPKSEITGSSPG